MKLARTIALLVWIAVFAAFIWLPRKIQTPASAPASNTSWLQSVYTGKLQTAFFSGFLTLAGFILSLKTNILLRLQKDLFENPKYQERVANAAALAGEPKPLYEPLVNLGEFLIWTVLICLFAAVVQITFGLVQKDWAVACCFATVASALVFVFFSWRAIRANLQLWFDLLKDKRVSPD